MRISVLAVALALSAWSWEGVAQSRSAGEVRKPQRLHSWLLEQDGLSLAYSTGLSWRVPEEQPVQLALKLELLRFLGGLPARDSGQAAFDAEGLAAWLSALPVTGRVAVASADPRWLEVNPGRDPVLLPGHSVDLPLRPQTVSVLTPGGVQCRVQHLPGQEALSYIRACSAPNGGDAADWAWVAQPDGRVERYGIASWNTTAQDLPAPGAWIWAPPRRLRIPEHFSGQLIRFLATQGPASDEDLRTTAEVVSPATSAAAGGAATGLRWSAVTRALVTPEMSQVPSPPVQQLPSVLQHSSRARDPMLTANDWGLVGALQTPSARMHGAGNLAFSRSRVEPYTRWNVVAQPFSWMEAGFRYTDIDNRAYGPASLSGDQSYKDKGFDAKFGLWPESFAWPALALGFTDIVGTGLFSSEYLVASKRWGNLDFSLGLAWGNLAGATRVLPAGEQVGNFSFGNYFSGAPRPFGSLQWMTPWQSLVLKAELDPNNYQNEPLNNRFEQRSRFNFGLVYRPYSWLDLTVGFERGNQLMLGLSINTDLSKLSMPKLSDPARVPIAAQRPSAEPDWKRTTRDFEVQTGWPVARVEKEGNQLAVTVDEPQGVYWQDKVDRAASVLHRDATAHVDRFVLRYQSRGMPLSEQVVEREDWVASKTSPLPPSQRSDSSLVRDMRRAEPLDKPLFEAQHDPWNARFRIGYSQNVGGPDAPILYQIYAEQSAQLQLFGRRDTWLSGALRLNMLNNYDNFKYTAPSNLPRVRTYIREYLVTSDLTLPTLQVTHARKLSGNQFASVYAGYLEEMFAGFGGEWLYRPFASRVAFGVDANLVRQRGFEQRFSMLDPAYQVATGHATLYWDTGWHGVEVQASVGRYLARDIGGTLQLSRRFSNGVVLGAYATKTNVSAEQFGEGSFDKGLFVAIPFDAMFTRTTGTVGYFNWRPLTRDGGAKLGRQEALYDITRTRDLRTVQAKAAPLPNDSLIPADHPPRWQPPVERQAVPAVPLAPVSDPLWRADERSAVKLQKALGQVGFRGPEVTYDGSHRLNLRVANEHLKPFSLGVGRAARVALRMAPAGVRELRIQYAEHNDPLVEYDFFDLGRLRAHFAGELSLAELRPFVAVRYINRSVQEADPLLKLADVTPIPETPPLRALIPSAHLPRTVLDDMGHAAREAMQLDWLRLSGIGLAAVAGSSMLDSRGQRFAKDHANSQWLKQFNRVGGALPWVGLAGAGLLALDSSDPRRQRTALAAGEAGVTAAVAATGLKYVFGRARPGYGSRKDFNWMDGGSSGRDSFPSRQSAMAWALATPFAEEYRAPWLYGLAAVTSLSRVGKQQHWVSDVVGSSLLGYGIGQLFWQSSRRNSNMPQVMIDGEGVGLSWTFY